jgi:tetratricopeptide (TPR) repeat protein
VLNCNLNCNPADHRVRLLLCAYCHSVDAFAWEVIGSVAGVIAAAAATIALIPRPRRHKDIPAPPVQAAAVVAPADTGTDAPVMVGEIPREPLGFQPRTDLLAALDASATGERVVVVHALTGLRGVGKTHLAAAYARAKLAERWRLVAWINAGDPGGILTGLAEVAVALEPGMSQPDAEAAARAVRRQLEIDGDRCLLVFDNAVDPELVQPFIPATGTVRVIITSNHLSMANLGMGVPVDVFTEDEALAFLAERTGSTDTAGAGLVAAELGYLPLALAQAAAVIATQHLGYATYVDRLQAMPVGELLRPVQAGQYPRGVAASVLLSLEGIRLGDDTGICVALMELLALLSAAGVRRTLVYEAARLGVLARDGQAGELPAEVADRALARLAGASLLTFSVDGSSVSVHRLVMRVIREQLAAGDSLTTLCLAAARLLDRLAGSLREGWHQDRPAVRDLVEQIMTLSESSPDGATDSALARQMMRLRLRAAVFLDLLGDSAAQSILIGESLLADMERVLGADHPDTLATRDNLASAYWGAGRIAEAITLSEQTLADRERVLGADHPYTLQTRNNLAIAYQDAGRTAEAITLYEQTRADMERVLGADHPDTLTTRNNLAIAYRAAGRTAEAITLYEQTLADRDRVLGADHPDTLTTRNNLAVAYRAAGRTAEAITLQEQPSNGQKSKREPHDP